MNLENLYSSATVKKLCADSRSVLVANLDRVHVLSHQDHLIVKCCQNPRTLEDHALNAVNSLGARSRSEVAAKLDSLRQDGLLISLSTLLRSAPETNSPDSSDILAIPTADRPDMLRRCVRSFFEPSDRRAFRGELHVLDDSLSASSASANAVTCKELEAECSSVSVRYGGPAEKRRFRDALEQMGIPGAVLRFTLPISENSCSFGGNRNFILLSTAGERFLCCDDDITCRLWMSPNLRPGVAVNASGDSAEWWFFEDRKAVNDFVAALSPCPTDLWAAHRAVLGKPVHALCESEGDCSIDALETDFAALLNKVSSGRVRISFSGVAGDSGMYTGGSFLFADGSIRAQLSGSQKLYRTAAKSRETARVTPKLTVTHSARIMSLSMGLDNRQLLPPFLPQFRNEDGVFGATLTICDPKALFAYVPVGVMHESIRTPEYPVTPLQAVETVRVSDTITALLEDCATDDCLPDARGRLRVLASQLYAIADTSIEHFECRVRNAILKSKCKRLLELDWNLNDGFCYPAFWVKDALMYREVLIAHLQSPDYVIPHEWRELDAEQALERLRAFVLNYASQLEWWDRIVAATAVLRARGLRPTVTVS